MKHFRLQHLSDSALAVNRNYHTKVFCNSLFSEKTFSGRKWEKYFSVTKKTQEISELCSLSYICDILSVSRQKKLQMGHCVNAFRSDIKSNRLKLFNCKRRIKAFLSQLETSLASCYYWLFLLFSQQPLITDTKREVVTVRNTNTVMRGHRHNKYPLCEMRSFREVFIVRKKC